MGLLSPAALFRFASAIYRYGINLMALLYFSAGTYGRNVALTDEKETLTYDRLLAHADALAGYFQEQYGLKDGKKVGVWCRNHAAFAKSIFAASFAGADLYLLHAEMSRAQLDDFLARRPLDLVLCDEDRCAMLEASGYAGPKLAIDRQALSIIERRLAEGADVRRLRRRSFAGKLVLPTGGTTGHAKEAPHRPSLSNYLDPFVAFMTRLRIRPYRTAYIATPLYHGYGIAMLLLFCALGKTMVLRRGFEARQACRLVCEHKVEVVAVVPLMLRRMLQAAEGDELRSLACIASGGAELHPQLAKETMKRLGPVLYNLYGTSEAGLATIATPKDLSDAPATIGRSIPGVRLRIEDERKRSAKAGTVGRIFVKNRRSARRREAEGWIDTGDMGRRDERGLFYLYGRADSMIVSGGENVYPIEVEHAILEHAQVEDAAVVGVRDEAYGQRLRAFVSMAPQASATKEQFSDWLRSRLARYQMPRDIVFVDQLPYTPLGKLDRKRLASSDFGIGV
ncbi:AMP-dependent synthetase [Paenibacillus antri]|uniref:AMP-dependent synthetase n=2 Tax=Paenibacillus antri TaxID=2582848 RepID=A0A5R9G478_9BACL|nr:AMP-dependent synthetase [Paenibacillus antri]